MARKKKTTVPVVEGVETGDDAELTSEERDELLDQGIDPDDEDVFRVSDEIRSQANVKYMITRMHPAARAGYVGEMSPSEFTLENVRKRFGGGRYRVRCVGSKGFVPGGGTVTIAETAESVPSSGEPTNITELMTLMDRREADRRAQNSERMMAYAQLIVPAMAPIIAALVTPRPSGISEFAAIMPKPMSTQDMVTFAASLKNLQGDSGEGKLETFLKVFETINDKIGGGGDVGWKDILKELVVSARPALERLVDVKLSSPSPQPVAGLLPLSQAPASIPQEGENVGMLSMIQWLRATLDQLLVQAQRNKNPELYAEVALDNLPEGTSLEQLRTWLAREDWWDVLKSFNPQVESYRGWITEFHTAALELIDAALNPDKENGDSNG